MTASLKLINFNLALWEYKSDENMVADLLFTPQ